MFFQLTLNPKTSLPLLPPTPYVSALSKTFPFLLTFRPPPYSTSPMHHSVSLLSRSDQILLKLDILPNNTHASPPKVTIASALRPPTASDLSTIQTCDALLDSEDDVIATDYVLKNIHSDSDPAQYLFARIYCARKRWSDAWSLTRRALKPSHLFMYPEVKDWFIRLKQDLTLLLHPDENEDIPKQDRSHLDFIPPRLYFSMPESDTCVHVAEPILPSPSQAVAISPLPSISAPEIPSLFSLHQDSNSPPSLVTPISATDISQILEILPVP